MIFDYSIKKTFEQSIDVVDIGNMCLRCVDDQQIEYYLITKTVMGHTNLLKVGPVCPDIQMLLKDFAINYKTFEYKDSTICKEVNSFINDPKKEIAEVTEITDYEMWEAFPNIKDCFNNI